MYIHVDKHLKLTGAPLLPLSESNMNMYYYLMQVDRRKIEEMRLPEKTTFTLPPCDASFMKVKAKLIDENSDNEILLETEELHVPLTLVSNFNQQFFFFQGRCLRLFSMREWRYHLCLKRRRRKPRVFKN